MFKRILVPLDGSARAESALPVAAGIARAFGGSITLVRVVETPTDYGAYLQTIIDEQETEATRYLESITSSADLEGVKVETSVHIGSVASTILSVANKVHVNLIVLSSHGNTGLKRWVMGSVAEKVARHAQVSVLVLREGMSLSQLTYEKPVRALIPLDGSPFSEAVIEPASYLVAGLSQSLSQSGELHLLRVIDLPLTEGMLRSQANLSAQMRAQAEQQAREYLDGLRKHLEEVDLLDLTITTSVESNPDVASAIVREAEGAGTRPFNLIAMAEHGRGGIDRFIMGSVTERVLHTTALPVLVVRPPKAQTDVHNHAEHQHAHARPAEGEKEVDMQPWVGLL